MTVPGGRPVASGRVIDRGRYLSLRRRGRRRLVVRGFYPVNDSAAPVTDLALVDRSPAPTWSGGTMAVTVDRVAAVERLPGSEHQAPYQRLALAFLVGYPADSARAYLGDLTAYGAWGAAAGVHPVDARRQHVDA